MARLDQSPDHSLIAWVILGCYTVMLYFQAATASVYESYQGGIEALKLIFSPAWVLAAVMIVGVFKPRDYAQVYRQLSILALLISVGMLPVLKLLDLIGSTYHASTNDLIVTICRSLFVPSVSNRSYVAVIKYGIIAACHAGGATLMTTLRTESR